MFFLLHERPREIHCYLVRLYPDLRVDDGVCNTQPLLLVFLALKITTSKSKGVSLEMLNSQITKFRNLGIVMCLHIFPRKFNNDYCKKDRLKCCQLFATFIRTVVVVILARTLLLH